MNLSELNTSELDLIIEALEHLPNKNKAGSMMVDLLSMALAGKDEESKLQMEQEREERWLQEEAEKAELTEKVKILQAKILIIKQDKN